MKEIKGNIFDITDADAICVTTNGVVKANGELAMGKGIAKQFAKKWDNLAKELGDAVAKYGNHVLANRAWIVSPEKLETMPAYHIVSFPTKEHFKDPSPLWLIERSAKELVILANNRNLKKIVLPRPGVGKGKLKWEDVKAVIEPILDDRFFVITPEVK